MKRFLLLVVFFSASSYADVRKEFCSYFSVSTLKAQAKNSELKYKENDFSDGFSHMIKKYDGSVSEWCKHDNRGPLKKLLTSTSEEAYADCSKLQGKKAQDCKQLVSEHAEKMRIYSIAYERGSADKNNELVSDRCEPSVNGSSRDTIKEISDKSQQSQKSSTSSEQ